MAIDKVYIFTIPRAKRRVDMCLGGLYALSTPPEKIEIFNGPDHKDYKSVNELCQAAADDGFPDFLKYNERYAVIAQNWAYCQLFRKIQQTGETALLMHDDAMLKFRFSRYEDITRRLKGTDPELKFIGLSSWGSLIDYPYYPEFETLIHKGLPYGAGDYCNIILPAFSEWILSYSYLKDCLALECFLSDFKDKLPSGFYSVPNELSAPRFDTNILPSMIHGDDGKALRLEK